MMHANPLVTIVIPTRNRKDLLNDALASVVRQDYKNLQIIVHDNNSQDETRELVLGYLPDERIEYYRSDSDLTMTENWNAAFSHVRGEYFLRLDDDNIIYNDFISSCIREIFKNDYTIVIFSPMILNVRNKAYAFFTPEQGMHTLNKYEWSYMEYFNVIDTNYILYRTDLVRKVMHPEEIYTTSVPDRYLNYRVAFSSHLYKVGFSTEIKGVTRLDHKPPEYGYSKLEYIDYNSRDLESLVEHKDCHDNFNMHRICTLHYFLKYHADERTNSFFERITSKSLYASVIRLGDLYMVRTVYTRRDLKIYCWYVYEIFSSFFRHPFSSFEGKHGLLKILISQWKVIGGVVVSVVNVLINNKKENTAVDKSFGDKIVRQVITDGRSSRYIKDGTLGYFSDYISCVPGNLE